MQGSNNKCWIRAFKAAARVRTPLGTQDQSAQAGLMILSQHHRWIDQHTFDDLVHAETSNADGSTWRSSSMTS
jgi:hypothetical protein